MVQACYDEAVRADENERGAKRNMHGHDAIVEPFLAIIRQRRPVMGRSNTWKVTNEPKFPDWDRFSELDRDVVSAVLTIGLLTAFEKIPAPITQKLPDIAWRGVDPTERFNVLSGEYVPLEAVNNNRTWARETIRAGLEGHWQAWLAWAWAHRDHVAAEPAGAEPKKGKGGKRNTKLGEKGLGGRKPIVGDEAARRWEFKKEVKAKRKEGVPRKVVAEKWGLKEGQATAWIQWCSDQRGRKKTPRK